MFVNMSSKHLYLAISQCRASWERGFLMKGWELGPDRHRECQVEPVLCRSYKIASIVDYKPAHSINNSIWAAHLARRSTVPRKSANASVTACIYTSAPLYILCERALVGRPRGEDFYLLICKYPPLCWLVTHYTLIGVCYYLAHTEYLTFYRTYMIEWNSSLLPLHFEHWCRLYFCVICIIEM